LLGLSIAEVKNFFVQMASDHFEKFKGDCLAQFKPVQAEFMNLYNLSSYEKWYFDPDNGIFQFESNDGRNLYFKYSCVGSFSEKSRTWKWSWATEHMRDGEREGLAKVKIYGEENELEPLSSGLVNGDEHTGWEMTAIAAKILNALGVYRFQEDDLTFYLIFTGEVDKDDYKYQNEKHVTCATHGEARAAFVCQHLNKDKPTGFHEPIESDPLIEQEDGYQGWCDECEKVRVQEGEWNEVSEGFANIKMICSHCFFEIKRRNGH